MATTADIVASVRQATGQTYADGAGPVTDAAILIFANEVYPGVRREIALIAPDRFATVTSGLMVASGAAEIDVSGLSGLDEIFEVNVLRSGKYRLVDPAGPDPEGSPHLCWRRRGMSGAGAAVEIYPSRCAPGTYQVRWLQVAPALVLTPSPNTVLLPAGGEQVLTQAAAAKVLDKLERDYSGRERARKDALAELAMQLVPRGGAIRDVTGRY